MAFRLRTNESAAHGMRRLVRKELRAARRAMSRVTPPDDECIHEARKSLKKVRAILALVEAGDGRDLAGSQKRLRRANRVLSRLRDADAMVKVLTELRNGDPQMLSEHTFGRVRHRLLGQKREASERANRDETWATVDDDFRKVRRAAKRWRPVKQRRFGAIARGIQQIYGKGRKAMARAQARQTAEDFHEWRKGIKALWYALRLAEGARGIVTRHAAALHRAETWLGEDHNVVVLCSALAKDGSICDGGVDVDRVRVSGHKYQCQMRTKAMAAVRQIYRRKPADYVRTIESAWDAYCHRRKVKRPRRHRAA